MVLLELAHRRVPPAQPTAVCGCALRHGRRLAQIARVFEQSFGVAQLLDALQRLHEAGTTLVLSTHDVELAYAWADQAAIFQDGTVLRQGETTAVLADRDLLQQARLRPPLLLELAQLLPGPLLRSREAVLAQLQERLQG